MVEVKEKYGFPLFSKPTAIVNLGKNEKLVISDIWSFWDYVIKKATADKKGENFLRSLLEQAKHFYQSAEESPVKSQPLLYYYSFLNLSKIMINLRGTFGPNKMYMHGMKEDHKHKFINSEVVKQRQKQQIVQVAHELVSLFDPNIPTTDVTLNTKDLLNHCVGVHRAYSEIYNQSEIFVRIKSKGLYKQGKTLIFKAVLQCSQAQVKELLDRGYGISTDEEGNNIYTETFLMDSYAPTRGDYYSLSEQIRIKGIWYFIGNSGYTMYLSTCANNRYSQESIIYMMMFYLGSITRYHPYMFDKIFSDKEQWLMSEFLNTQPKQFLYLATANVLGQSVLKAYASF
ncbi:YaaC family protein [Methylicorpusculum sp.]|uniref:YaaC family protein n=1 Tax=Methylicorpusculum sp. TaxID=2713644 RepID=UPI002730CD21|nr:YaaC family protein [Methylicorpusculum sp.]MDP2180859.1 YaaC family protein [Methylicorpusculum sp.]MDP3531335.1 YaaC family protein [Methylicorpusculum sp.]